MERKYEEITVSLHPDVYKAIEAYAVISGMNDMACMINDLAIKGLRAQELEILDLLKALVECIAV